jgi:alpha-ketoglutarate-dependent taurine dioxygenase
MPGERNMEIRDLDGPFGAEIVGLDLTQAIDAATRDAIVQAIYDKIVVCIRDQTLSPTQFAAFGRQFGEPMVHVEKDILVDGVPEVMTLSNADGRPDRQRNGGNHWHTDLVFTETPASFTMLNAVAVPRVGGETGFADQCAAYNALPDDLREQAEQITVAHCYEGRRDGSFPTVYHPLVRPHPVTGRKALYGANSTCIGIQGMDDAPAAEVLDQYRDYALAESVQYYHQYQDHDVVIWDNAMSLHTGPRLESAGGDIDPRVMNRVSVRGWPAVH